MGAGIQPGTVCGKKDEPGWPVYLRFCDSAWGLHQPLVAAQHMTMQGVYSWSVGGERRVHERVQVCLWLTDGGCANDVLRGGPSLPHQGPESPAVEANCGDHQTSK